MPETAVAQPARNGPTSRQLASGTGSGAASGTLVDTASSAHEAMKLRVVRVMAPRTVRRDTASTRWARAYRSGPRPAVGSPPSCAARTEPMTRPEAAHEPFHAES